MKKLYVIPIACFIFALAGPAAAQTPTDEQRQRGRFSVLGQQLQDVETLMRELERVRNLTERGRLDDQRVREIGELYQALQQAGGGRGARTGGPGSQSSFDPRTNDPTSGPVVANAPFSADALTTVTQTLGDGTNITQRASAKFYRDGTGRFRREQTIVGIDWANPRAPGEPITVITIDSEPGDPRPYQLDTKARTARRVSRASAASAGGVSGGITLLPLRMTRADGTAGALLSPSLDSLDMPVNFQGLTIPRRGIPADLRPAEEQLGTRQMDGIKATGRKTTVTIPTDRVGNDRPIQIVDERWESPELGVVIYSRFSDPRTGIVEYRLTNINRSEPAASLFTIPSDYTITGEPGARGRGIGAGGRGGARTGGPPQQ